VRARLGTSEPLDAGKAKPAQTSAAAEGIQERTEDPGGGGGRPGSLPLVELAGPGGGRVVIHRRRFIQPEHSTPEARSAAVEVLRGLIAELLNHSSVGEAAR